MAMPLETPSRIWKRIKESEAHDVEMPSLPSLPALDESGLSDLDHSSFSLVNDAVNAKPALAPDRCSKGQPSAAPPPTSGDRAPAKAPKMPFNATTVQGCGFGAQYDDVNVDTPSSQYLPGDREDDAPPRDTKFDNRTVDIPASRGASFKKLQQPADPPCTPALNGKSSTMAAQPVEVVIGLDRNLAPIDKSQAPLVSGNGGLLPEGINLRESKDFTARGAYVSNRQPLSVPSLPSSSLTIPTLPNISDARSSTWNIEEDREDATDQELETVTMRPSVETEDEQLQQTDTDRPSEIGIAQSSGGTTKPRESTFSSEDAESTRGTAVRFSKFVALPAGLTTPAQTILPARGRTRGYQNIRQEQNGIDDLATPLPRRKSFLLSVVNSATRPRLAVPTPHPHPRNQKAVIANTGLTPAPSHLFNTGTRRARLSHRLSQVSAFVPSSPLLAVTEGEDLPEGITNSSFVSTASSHDLTLRHRANASFDPLTGPQGVGRFNASKLNTYLHGLNRRLQEENEVLVNKIRSQQEELEILYAQTSHPELSGVREDDAAEQWVLEKESLERKIAELEKQVEAKDKELADEQTQRMHDKERWKERMSEVEDGVGQIIADLEKRVEEAEMKASSLKEAEHQLRVVQSELDSAKAKSKAGGSDLRAIGEQDLQNIVRQLDEKDGALATLQASLADKEREVSSLQNIIANLESSLRVTRETIESSQQHAKQLQEEQRNLKDELRTAQATVDRLKSESSEALDPNKYLEKQLAESQESLAEKKEALDIANERVTATSDELEKARANIQQLETALEESDRKIISDNNELLELRSKLSSVERVHETRLLNQSQDNVPGNGIDVEVLETELAEARKEIGRLRSLLDQNPARKALDKARESRIDLLEKENQELLEQLRTVRDASSYATPRRSAPMSGLSPMHRRLLNLTLRTPKTPGEPLRNASWLMNTTGEITTTHLIDEIGRLQRELDLANESIDDKLDKLEEAGLGVVGLTKALEDARQRIVDLERQVGEREVRLPGDGLCPYCRESQGDRPARKDPNTTLQLRLTMVTAELEMLRKQRDDELASSSGEKAVLRDAKNRLNVEIKRAKEELKAAKERGYKAEKSKAELQQDLAKAKKTIDDLEYYLQAERTRLRTMGIENLNAAKEKERIMEKLFETEQKMEKTRDRLFQLKETNIKLETELKVERKTANIEEALIGNREIIERLREERSQLSDKYYDLQQRLAEASRNANDLATKHAKLQMSYDGRRRQLDRQAEEIDSLRTALSSQAQTMNATRSKNDAEADDEQLKSLASRLQTELKRIQQEANRFGRDLVHLKAERGQLEVRHREELEQHERETKQVRAQLRNLKQQLAGRKENRDLATEIQVATEALRLRHNQECKGLFVQIRYLKAKFTREAALRDDLGYQKSYLLVLLSRYEKSEKKILATIAQIGPIMTPSQSARPRSLRKVALVVIFVCRARRASETWREQRSACFVVAAALDNVRKNRTLKV